LRDAGRFDEWLKGGAQGNYSERRFADPDAHVERSLRACSSKAT
jgi:hypothetical protein